MGDLIIKPASSGNLKIQDQGGTERISLNTSGVTTFASNTTFSGTGNDIGTATAGTIGGNVTLSGFTGMVAAFAMSSAPTGWLTCDGTAVSRTTYSDLFTAIGTTWGSGDGTTTFNLPDLRGAFLRGTGSHGTSNMANGNDFAGPSVGSFENDSFQGHGHNIRGDEIGSGSNMIDSLGGDASGVQSILEAQPGGDNGYFEVDSNGTPRHGDETRPFNAGINYCIKI